MPPSVTLAMPFYSGADYLARAVRSIVAQEDSAWDAVVCDDGAESGIEAVVRDAGAGRVRYQRNERNLGMAGNFNRCVDVATTELVTVVHADDELAPGYVRTMRAAAERHPDAAAIFCRATIIDESGVSVFSMADVVKEWLVNPSPRQELVLAGEPGVRALITGNFIMAPTLCFRKTVLGARRFPDNVKFVMDWELTMRLLLDGESLVGLPDRCYRYRRHSENATSEFTRTQLRFHEESEFYDRVKREAQARGWDTCVNAASEKRMLKLNVMFNALKNVASLDLNGARDRLRLLREL